MTGPEKHSLVQINRNLEYAKDPHSPDRFKYLTDAVYGILGDPVFADILKKSEKQIQLTSESDLYGIAFTYLRMFLMRRDYESAATLLWGEETFTYEPRSVKMVWNGIMNNHLLNILGAASMGKTYSASAWMLLDWVLDPDWTLVRVMSTKEEHVKKNLFGDMQRLYQNAVIPLPGKADSESIATEQGKRGGMGIFILTISRGTEARGAIKGAKIKPRPAHPLFGTSSRSRLLIDEAQEVPANAFEEIPNLYSSMEEGDIEHTKIVMAANPKDPYSEYGKNCTPEKGWEDIQTIDSSTDLWTSTTGWSCVRLNAMKSENVINKQDVYKRFFTWNGYKMKLRQYNGDPEHPMMWSEVYGMFPPKGNKSAIIQKHWVDRNYGEWIFDGPTETIAALDPAYTGDMPAMATGRAGHAVGWRTPDGVRHDLKLSGMRIQIDAVGILPHGDTQDLADETMSRLKELGVAPENFAIDRTGIGQGTHDNIRRQWHQKVMGASQTRSTDSVSIMGINYAESATEFTICQEDTKTPKQLYDGVRSEVWYATGRFFEYDYVKVGAGVDLDSIQELVDRRGGSPVGKGKLLQVESKDSYKSRGNHSPDRADAVTMLVQCARISVSIKPISPDSPPLEEPPTISEMSGSFSMKMGEPVNLGFNYKLPAELNINKD
jgi:hypothetical protein